MIEAKRVSAVFYRTEDGAEPVRAWLKSMAKEDRFKMTNGRNPHLGSTLDELLEEDRSLADAHAIAVKRVLAWQVGQTMADLRITKSEMARRMGTSRSALARLLDPENPSVTLLTLDRAAAVLGKRLTVDFADRKTA